MQVQLLVVSWAVSWALQPSELSSLGSSSIGVARVYRHRQHTQVGLLLRWASMTASPRHSHQNQMQRPRSIMCVSSPIPCLRLRYPADTVLLCIGPFGPQHFPDFSLITYDPHDKQHVQQHWCQWLAAKPQPIQWATGSVSDGTAT